MLVNNAGIGSFSKLESIKMADFDEIFSTNVFGLTMMTQEVVKFFKTQQFGTIINIGSTASTNGFASGSVYCASKFALRGLTYCWRSELRGDNIRLCLLILVKCLPPLIINKEQNVKMSRKNFHRTKLHMP